MEERLERGQGSCSSDKLPLLCLSAFFISNYLSSLKYQNVLWNHTLEK
jgi:hypothetical protein